MKNKEVVILIITHKAQLEPLELISIQQCFKILGNYRIVFICPKGLESSFYRKHFPNGELHYIPSYWLSNYRRFNRLKIMPLLYNAYRDYKYILFYEPDAFVFKDDLAYWCAQGYSYIGAPWFERISDTTKKASLVGVGNGGFSLRKVEDHLRAIYKNRMIFRLSDYNFFITLKGSKFINMAKFIFRFLVGNSTYYLFNNFQWEEDRFWGIYVERANSFYTTPSPEKAKSFSMEICPRRLYEENDRELPFGCHAWWRYDLKFWKPHIESFGYRLES